MLRSELQNDQIGELQYAIDALAVGLRVAAVGIVQSYNPDMVTVTVQLVGRESFRQSSGEYGRTELPLLVDVPVVFPHSRDFVLTFPIKPGDECLVIFSDRCFDAWFQSGGVQNQVESRMHDLSDAIAIVGPYSQVTKVPNPHTENVQLRHFNGNSYIEMTPDEKLNIIMRNNIYIHSDTDIQIEAPHIGLNDNL